MHQEQFVYSATVDVQQYVGPYRLEKTLGKGQTGKRRSLSSFANWPPKILEKFSFFLMLNFFTFVVAAVIFLRGPQMYLAEKYRAIYLVEKLFTVTGARIEGKNEDRLLSNTKAVVR